jgi:hypothetical protein
MTLLRAKNAPRFKSWRILANGKKRRHDVGYGQNGKESGDSGWIGSAITGAALFAGLLIFLGSVPLAVAGGVAGLVAGSLIFKSRPVFDKTLIAQGITQEMLDEALKRARSRSTPQASGDSRLSPWCSSRSSRSWRSLTRSWMTSAGIPSTSSGPALPELLPGYHGQDIEGYAALSSKKVLDPEVMKSLKKVELLLDQIRLAFHKQLPSSWRTRSWTWIPRCKSCRRASSWIIQPPGQSKPLA